MSPILNTENLTPLQLRYIAALVNREPYLNSIDTVRKYKLGSPGNLSTIKNALDTKENLAIGTKQHICLTDIELVLNFTIIQSIPYHVRQS